LRRLTLNAGKHTANQPTRLAHLDDGNAALRVARFGTANENGSVRMEGRFAFLLPPRRDALVRRTRLAATKVPDPARAST